MTVEGVCDPRFDVVRQAMLDNLTDRGDLGAAVTVVVGGRVVADLWGGWQDSARRLPWQRDTLVNVFSVGKAMATVCLLLLVDRGRLDLDAPVARYWPEFAARGKGSVTVRMVLAHRAGLPAIREQPPELAKYDWPVMAGALADEEPWWPPGTAHGYHVNTFGFLVGELVRRVSGRSIGELFRSEVAGPLGADVYFGLSDQDCRRAAEFQFSEETLRARPTGDQALLRQVYDNPPGISGVGTVNTAAWRTAQIPSTNAHATAAGVAQIYTMLLAGRLLRPATLEQAITEASAGQDLVLSRPSRFGLGFQLTQPERPLGPNPHAFGHFGAGGSLGFADPDADLAFAYVMNRSGPRWQNPRNRALIDAVYAALGAAPELL